MSSPQSVIVRKLLGTPEVITRISAIIHKVHRIAPYVIDKDDLFQIVVTQLLQSSDQFTGSNADGLVAWVGRIAHNCLISQLRKRSPIITSSSTSDAIDISTEANVIAEIEQQEWLSSLLSRLPERERRLVEARLLGLSYDQISLATGLSVAAARQSYHRAILHLRRLVDVFE